MLRFLFRALAHFSLNKRLFTLLQFEISSTFVPAEEDLLFGTFNALSKLKCPNFYCLENVFL